MYLAEISLSGFRNYENVQLTLSPKHNIFYGCNGQGKSNLLEAVYMLSIAKTARTSRTSEILSWDLLEKGGHMQILGVVREKEITMQVQVDADVMGKNEPGGPAFRKSLRINGIQCGTSEFVGHVNTVYFEPADMALINGSPEVRRRYLDILVSQSERSYLKTRQRYDRVLRQRNNLLKNIKTKHSIRGELEFWNERIAYEGAAIVKARQQAVDLISAELQHTHKNLMDGGDMKLEYLPKITLGKTPRINAAEVSREEIQQMFAREMNAAYESEIVQGSTLVGPHRDDLLILLNRKPAAFHASRGQARMLAFSLKIAEASVMRNTIKRSPILALDDIFSELDERHRTLVMDSISSYEQSLITTTETAYLPRQYVESANIYVVDHGKVTQADG